MHAHVISHPNANLNFEYWRSGIGSDAKLPSVQSDEF